MRPDHVTAVERAEAAAAIHLRQRLSRCLEESAYDSYVDDWDRIAGDIADGFVVTFERQINEHGVPVRRVVATGDWECDPMNQPERTTAP